MGRRTHPTMRFRVTADTKCGEVLKFMTATLPLWNDMVGVQFSTAY